MKTTNRNARKDRAGKHNDRNFNLDNAEHIDQARVRDNIYYTYNGDTEHSFTDIELEFYEAHFGDRIEDQNKRNIKAGHPERNHTVADYYHQKNSRPEDKILQIGNIHEHASGEELWECALTYKDRFNELYGDKCKILDMALHLDEATPHVHIRRVWIAEDEQGRQIVSQTKALEQLGISAPDSSKAIGKYNNAKITFTQTDQKLFRDICIEKGLDIDIEPANKREHLETLEYKKKQISEDIEELERTRDTLKTEIDDIKNAEKNISNTIDTIISYFETDPFFGNVYETEIEEAKKKSRVEQFKLIADLYNREMIRRMQDKEHSIDRNLAQYEGSEKVRSMTKFLKSKGLYEEYANGSQDNPEGREDIVIPTTSYF